MNADTRLLYPAFYIHEVFGGETIIQAIAFSPSEQAFFIKESRQELSQPEVIQRVRRGLVPWILGNDLRMEEQNENDLVNRGHNVRLLFSICAPQKTRHSEKVYPASHMALCTKNTGATAVDTVEISVRLRQAEGLRRTFLSYLESGINKRKAGL